MEKKPTNTGKTGKQITREKYTWAVHEIIRELRNTGPKPGRWFKQFTRAYRLTGEMHKLLVDAGLIENMAPKKKNGKWRATPKAVLGQYDTHAVLDAYFADRDARQIEYREKRLAKQAKNPNGPGNPGAAPMPMPTTPPVVPPAPPAQIPLFGNPGDNARLTWEEWHTAIRAKGYVIVQIIEKL